MIARLPKEERLRRVAICNAPCPNKEPVERFARCLKCGCFIAAKTAMRGASCPDNKWSAYFPPEQQK